MVGWFFGNGCFVHSGSSPGRFGKIEARIKNETAAYQAITSTIMCVCVSEGFFLK